MTLGEKLKKVRCERNMTQSELAGDYITRNMLSRIENGSAYPSLQTIEYIANRLDLPVDYFLSAQTNDFVFRKPRVIGEIRAAYAEKRYADCIGIIDKLSETDDELNLLLSGCYLGIGLAKFESGFLREAQKAFLSAQNYARQTIYMPECVLTQSSVYLKMINITFPDLSFRDSNIEFPDQILANGLYGIDIINIYQYLKILVCFCKNEFDAARAAIKGGIISDEFYSGHLNAKLMVSDGNYAEAKKLLTCLTKYKVNPILKYLIYADLELCCTKLGDFEDAYYCSSVKLDLYMKMCKQ